MSRLARRYATYWILTALDRLHGENYGAAWAWELTPIPCGLPTWGQLAQGLMLALTPWPFARRVMRSQIRTAYRQMDLAVARSKRS